MLEFVFVGLIMLSTPEGQEPHVGVFQTEQECREKTEAVLKMENLPITAYTPCTKFVLVPKVKS